MLAHLGFKALATTSAGFAWSLGKADNRVTLDEALSHYRAIVASVDVPVNADFEGGFAVRPKDVETNVGRAVETGVAGLSIEDSTGDAANPLFELDLAVDRIRAARSAIDRSGSGVLLTGRSEGFIANRPDIDETIRRLRAYAEAGADCLYAPGIKSEAHIKAVVAAVAPKPVNVLVSSDFTTVAALAQLGVRRISVGAALARAAWRVRRGGDRDRGAGHVHGARESRTSARSRRDFRLVEKLGQSAGESRQNGFAIQVGIGRDDRHASIRAIDAAAVRRSGSITQTSVTPASSHSPPSPGPRPADRPARGSPRQNRGPAPRIRAARSATVDRDRRMRDRERAPCRDWMRF